MKRRSLSFSSRIIPSKEGSNIPKDWPEDQFLYCDTGIDRFVLTAQQLNFMEEHAGKKALIKAGVLPKDADTGTVIWKLGKWYKKI
jgi:hypothetical protein